GSPIAPRVETPWRYTPSPARRFSGSARAQRFVVSGGAGFGEGGAPSSFRRKWRFSRSILSASVFITLNSTRRFLLRPSAVVLGALGCEIPYPRVLLIVL